jgi:hypothetical protein
MPTIQALCSKAESICQIPRIMKAACPAMWKLLELKGGLDGDPPLSLQSLRPSQKNSTKAMIQTQLETRNMTECNIRGVGVQEAKERWKLSQKVGPGVGKISMAKEQDYYPQNPRLLTQSTHC